MPNLTKIVVDHAQARPGKHTYIYDSKLKGFSLRISKAGVKAFCVEYRLSKKMTRRVTLGRFGVLTVDQARSAAKDILLTVALGGDPAADKKRKNNEITVKDLLDRYVAEHVRHNNKASTQEEIEAAIPRWILPKLGKLQLSELTKSKVKDWHLSLAHIKPSANRCLAYLQRACRHGIELDLLRVNPCVGITRYQEKPKVRFFSDDELNAIGFAMRALVDAHVLLPQVQLGLQLIALTGLRAGEVRTLRWSNFDVQRQVLRLEDSKIGARNVRLFPEALKLLKNAIRSSAFIVPSVDPSKPIAERSFSSAFEKVLARADIQGTSLHTFRHTMATYMAQNGCGAPEIAVTGGWKTLAMVQRYIDLQAVGEPNPIPAGQRIWMGLEGDAAVIHTLVRSA